MSDAPSRTDAERPFRWGILGTGGVSRKFLLGLRALGGAAEVVACASRDPANARAFARSLGVADVGTYEEVARHPGVDGLYVATPPSEHERHAMLGLEADRAVLVEKPFAMDAAAARRIVQAARSRNLFCMEAMWTRFLPLMAELRRLVERGAIGEPRAFHGAFWGASVVDPASSAFDPARGGGALMHRGVYPLSVARDLLGPIEEVRAMGRIGSTGVDEDCAVSLRHASGAVSTLRASLRADGDTAASIHGTEGTIRIRPPLYRPFAATLTPTRPRRAGRGGGRLEGLREGAMGQGLVQRAAPVVGMLRRREHRIAARYAGNGYGHEARAVMDAVARGETESAVMPLDQSVEVMEAIDAARAAWAGRPEVGDAAGARASEQPARAAPVAPGVSGGST